ncbi:MAG: hypothetical protein EB141_03730 [Verrucomicrobia bacterium]|nr:hypothetical protein [Verrucomicrobiota bacterium]NBU08576.1 hypothetical protein [Pseudomonadota bacterium]NDA65475.1 hypothetical protein [Verrucomicrobiota bacterium]NDB74748.1 hypothetical protein [Verrucomicrobiota bacterium]NDD37341.1 hypothetical protein [Verrucomicrobiota bacterium]
MVFFPVARGTVDFQIGHMKLKLLPPICLAILAVAFPVAAQDDKPASTLSVEVPATVKAAIQKEAEGGRVVELNRVNEDGKQQYEATVSHEGLEYAVRVDLRGVVVRVELKNYNDAEDQSLNQLPAAVRDSFKKLARGGSVENTRRQRLAYTCETRLDGKRYAITTDEQGRLLKKELQQDDNENK